jgi:hypothetical protein
LSALFKATFLETLAILIGAGISEYLKTYLGNPSWIIFLFVVVPIFALPAYDLILLIPGFAGRDRGFGKELAESVYWIAGVQGGLAGGVLFSGLLSGTTSVEWLPILGLGLFCGIGWINFRRKGLVANDETRAPGWHPHWPRLLMVPTAKNIAWIVVAMLLVILFVESVFLTLLAHYSTLDAVSITGWAVGIIALVLYLLDAFSVEPVFLRIQFFPIDKTPREFRIEATVSNEGGMKVHSCQVEVRREGEPTVRLNRVIVEGPLGNAIMADPPNDIINDFPLFPKRATQVRGYITAPDNTKVTIVIKAGKSEYSPVSFHLSA